MKTSLFYDTSTGGHHSSRNLVVLAALFAFRLFYTDVTQACLQIAEDLMRDVLTKPTKENGIGRRHNI